MPRITNHAGETLDLVRSDGYRTWYEGRMFKAREDGRFYEYAEDGTLSDTVWWIDEPNECPRCGSLDTRHFYYAHSGEERYCNACERFYLDLG
jgi:hypothetical protein